MSVTRSLLLLTFAGAAFGMLGCGLDQEYLTAVQINPPSGTATSGSSSNTVQFHAVGWYGPMDCGSYGCFPGKPNKNQLLTNASWSTSDAVNSTIAASGLAKCVSPASSPITITATAPGGLYGSIKGTATLVCN